MMRASRLLWLGTLLLGACTTAPHRTNTPPAVPKPGVTQSPESTVRRPLNARPTDAELLALPDAVPRLEPRATAGNPAFYEVYGQRYTVLPSAHGYTERGVASWYGPDFHGIATSTGEPYDMYGMTAAHKTLPLPAYVRVTNLRNGRTIVVRVNDRGPFKANRIIDLSYAAALKLDMIRDGTTLVEIQAEDPDGGYLGDAVPTSAALYAQVGAFSVLSNAERLRDRLLGAGISNVSIRSETGVHPVHRVRVGPVDSVDAYDALVEKLRRQGVEKAVLAPN